MRVIVRFTEEARKPFQDVPSLRDLGYNIDAVGFIGLFAPKGLPAHIQKKLEEEFTQVLHDPSVTEAVDGMGETLFFRNNKDFGIYLKGVYEQARKEFKELGLGLYAKDKK
jgi:tripartite-type tricarboxylate transporter receptor subunit TctC